MKSLKSLKASLLGFAIFLTCNGASAQTENPSPIKGRWGLSTGITFDQYKTDILFQKMKLGILPMLTYTYGKNQFELGPQFQLATRNTRNEYLGVNFQYKRYFNGFGNRFVPYLYSGIGFTMSKYDGIHYESGIIYSTGYDYQQIGVNLSIGYGLEWQLGKHFYLGSAVGFNPGIYSVTRSQMPFEYTEGVQTTKTTGIGLNFNVNMQVGYRFGK
ncbi:hypothetical protein [Fluviicola taffensis]|uniref:Outer membrane protein beta-barrel domain-containing protein n=1 Tax=Fluviicola taffensis (strain DSM 16823 / NCIMB 13979 / RW262) TaxID=755732 RepID=F2IH77_FLUTR|nr:hypothetical protein [Fluviicola taffensis]AEA42632.1 hypothetical protein Fluta_0628 [Fluviicola taffensis DSM 16823]